MSKSMSKSHLAKHLAEKLEVPAKTAAAFLEELAAQAAEQTRAHGDFTIPGVGKLVLQDRKAREGRNPATGEKITIPAKTVLKFRLGKAIKDAVVPG